MAPHRVPTVTAVIALHSASASLLSQVLSAAMAQRVEADVTIVCVSNGSANLEGVAEAGRAQVHLWEPGINLGYAGGIEWVRRETSSDFIWVLQEDVAPEPDCLGRLLNEFNLDSRPSFGAVTPSELTHDRSPIAPARRSGSFDWATGAKGPDAIVEARGGIVWSESETSPWTPYVFLSGALISCPALEAIGGVDAAVWPFQYVDVDVSKRLLGAGYGLKICDAAKVWHIRNYERYSGRSSWRKTAYESNGQYLLRKARGATIASSAHMVPADIVWAVAQASQRFLEVQTGRMEPIVGLTPREDLRRVLRRIAKVIHRRFDERFRRLWTALRPQEKRRPQG